MTWDFRPPDLWEHTRVVFKSPACGALLQPPALTETLVSSLLGPLPQLRPRPPRPWRAGPCRSPAPLLSPPTGPAATGLEKRSAPPPAGLQHCRLLCWQCPPTPPITCALPPKAVTTGTTSGGSQPGPGLAQVLVLCLPRTTLLPLCTLSRPRRAESVSGPARRPQSQAWAWAPGLSQAPKTAVGGLPLRCLTVLLCTAWCCSGHTPVDP